MSFSIFERALPVVGFSFIDIQEYILKISENYDVQGQNSALKESVAGAKLFKKNFIQDFKFLELNKDGFTMINAIVKADELDNTNHCVCLTISAENKVLDASCECPGSTPSSSCKHMFAVLTFILEYCSKELHRAPMEKLQEWYQPVRKEEIPPEETVEMYFESLEETEEMLYEEAENTFCKNRFSRRDDNRKKCCLCWERCLKSSSFHFHRFPKDPELSDKWAAISDLKYVMKASPAQRYTRYLVCSQHFSRDDYKNHKSLMPKAVPSFKRNKFSIDLKKLKEKMSLKLSDSTSISSDEKETLSFRDVSENVPSPAVKGEVTFEPTTPRIEKVISLGYLFTTPKYTKKRCNDAKK